MLTHLLIYCLAVLGVALVPGPDMLLIINKCLSQGKQAGLITVLGISMGLFVHILAVTIGLSSLIVHSPLAFSSIKYLGAGYLFYLGVTAWRSAPPDFIQAQKIETKPIKKNTTPPSTVTSHFLARFYYQCSKPKSDFIFSGILTAICGVYPALLDPLFLSRWLVGCCFEFIKKTWRTKQCSHSNPCPPPIFRCGCSGLKNHT